VQNEATMHGNLFYLDLDYFHILPFNYPSDLSSLFLKSNRSQKLVVTWNQKVLKRTFPCILLLKVTNNFHHHWIFGIYFGAQMFGGNPR